MAFRALHERLVDLAHEHRAHRHRAVGQALGSVMMSGITSKSARRTVAETAEAGDDFIEDQQYAVLVADLAQALQIALGRQHHPGGAGHRFDDHGGDRRGIMQRDQALEIIGKVVPHAARRARTRCAPDPVYGADDPRPAASTAEHFSVVDHAADGDAAEADAVIALLAADQSLRGPSPRMR